MAVHGLGSSFPSRKMRRLRMPAGACRGSCDGSRTCTDYISGYLPGPPIRLHAKNSFQLSDYFY